MRRVLAPRLVAASVVGLSAAACGGGGGGDPVPFRALALAPDTFVGVTPQPFTLTIQGIPRNSEPGGTMVVRFTATDGTPFLGGTSAVVDVVGAILDDATIAGFSPGSIGVADAVVSAHTDTQSTGPEGPVAHFFERAPVAVDDDFTTIGNQPVGSAAPGVLANDSDPDGDAIAVVAFDATTTGGGTVSMAADGGFSYVPAAGFEGVDTFTYTVSDGVLSDTATVTVTVTDVVWVIDGAAPPGGNGTFAAPFDTLAAFMARQGGGPGDPEEGDVVYVASWAGVYAGSLTLLDGQSLLGGGEDLVVGGTLLATAGARPVLRGSGGTTLTLATDNVVRALDVENTAGTAVGRPSDLDPGTIVLAAMRLATTGGPAIDSAGVDATFDASLDAVTVVGSAGGGVVLRNALGSLAVAGTTAVEVTGGTTAAVDLAGSSLAAAFPAVDLDAVLDGVELGSFRGTFTCLGGTVDAGRHVLRALDAHGPAASPARIEVRGCRLTSTGLAFRLGAATDAGASGHVLELVVVDDDLQACGAAALTLEADLVDGLTYVALLQDNRFPSFGDVELRLGAASDLHATVIDNVAALGTLRNVGEGGTFYLDVRENSFATYEVTAANPGSGVGVVVDPPFVVTGADDVELWLETMNTGDASVADFFDVTTGFFDATGLILVP